MVQQLRYGYLLITTLLACGTTIAAETNVSLFVTGSETYTTNVEQVDEDEQSSFITEVTPGISVEANGARVKLQGRYQAQGLLYTDDSDFNTINHQLNSSGEVELWRDRVFAYGSANFGQYDSTLRRSGAASDNLTANNNRADVFDARVGARWQQFTNPFLHWSLDGSLNYTDAGGSDSSVSDTTGHNIYARLANGDYFESIYWNALFSESYSDPDDRGSDKFRYYTGELGTGIGADVSVYLHWSKEENSGSEITRTDTNTEFWGPGLRWRPSSRSSLSLRYQFSENESSDDHLAGDIEWTASSRSRLFASYDKRFFGDNYTVNFTHNTRRLRNSFGLDESITSYSRLLQEGSSLVALVCPDVPNVNLSECRLVDLNEESIGPGEIIVGSGTALPGVSDEVFVDRAARWSVAYRSGKSTYSLSMSYNRRESLEDGDLNRDFSIRPSYALRFGRRTSAQLSYVFRRQSFDEPDLPIERSYEDIYTASLNHTLSPKTTATFSVSYRDRDDDDDNNSYEETRVSASITVRL